MKSAASLLNAIALERPVIVQRTGPVQLILRIIGWRCWCTTRTRVFMDNDGPYTRCLECGRRLPYGGPLV